MAATKTPPKCRGKECAIAADRHVASLETELANIKAAHTRLVDDSARVEEDANKARTELRDFQVRVSEVAKETKVANGSLEEVRQQSVKSAKAVREASRQLTELSGRAQTLEMEVNYYDRNWANSLEHAMT